MEESGGELAVIGAGGYIGEMSLLTGQPRSATVEAIEECLLLELTAESLREVALANPETVRLISSIVSERQAAIEKQKAHAAASHAAAAEPQRSLLSRIQEFLRLPTA